MNHHTRQAVIELAEPFHLLGLITEDELDTVRSHLDKVDVAEQTAREHDALAEQVAADAGQTLADTDDIDPEDIRDAARGLPDKQAVERIATRVANAAVSNARAVAFSQLGKLPTAVNERYDALIADWEQVAAKLDGVTSADQAIERGKVKVWQEYRGLLERYVALGVLVKTCKRWQVIADPRPGTGGAHWRFRVPAPFGDAVPSADGGDDFARFRWEMARKPWLPPSQAAADELFAQWEAQAQGVIG